MIFLFEKKNHISFLRYLDFCVFICEIHIFQNLWRDHRRCYVNKSYTYGYFFWILSTVKMKFGLILVCCMTNISNMFLTQCWRLKTSSRPFYDFFKMIIQPDMAIFNSWHVPFINVPYSPFQKNETLESWHNWLFSNWSRLLNLKGPRT